MAGRGTASGGPMKPGRRGHTPASLAAGFAITASPGPGGPSRQAARPVIPLTAQPDNGGAGQMQRHLQVPSRRAAAPGQAAVRRHCRSRGPGLRGRAGSPREETFNRVSARRAGSVTRHPQARPRPAAMWPPAAADVSLTGPLSCCRPTWPQSRLCRWLASAQLLPAGYALRVDGEFVAAGRRGTAGSGACPSLVFSCPGRIACGAPAGSQIRAPGRGRSCRWPCRAVGGRASGLDVAAGPRSASQPGREPGPAVADLSGSRTARAVPARPAPGKRALYADGAAAGIDPWLPQPVLAILVSMLDQWLGRHLLVLE